MSPSCLFLVAKAIVADGSSRPRLGDGLRQRTKGYNIGAPVLYRLRRASRINYARWNAGPQFGNLFPLCCGVKLDVSTRQGVKHGLKIDPYLLDRFGAKCIAPSGPATSPEG